ncbi:oligoendopeptidase F [Oscillochloris sp. ZM17-4]|uniref:oligoendopeptidase F n=1 Tax=Oscillochloris sp. ZM17-4 TaxID=2866714 RepID=UPI001C734F5F|nr:oligoendopeptidase F [Oscillochloris sp. ZM17-4]MBX0329033.1 oligoendopeptidase F [Oscillochloris sp. ZM17-4]
MAQTVPTRSEVPAAYTWDAHSVFADDAAWEAAIASVEAGIPEIAAYAGRLAEDPAVLADYLALAEVLLRSAGHVGVYARMFYAVDTADTAAQAKTDRAQSLAARLGAAMAFGEPELLAIGGETLEAWAGQEPRLAHYRHHFARLARRAAHVRSAEVEALLRQAGEPFAAASATHGILANADLRFAPARDSAGEPYEIAQGTINALVTHADPAVRKSAWESYADAHLDNRNTMASCLSAGVKQDVFAARARRYGSSLEAALTPNEIPLEVFHNLIATFTAHLPIWHRYWRVRRKALGLREMHVYDTKAPLTSAPMEVPYAQAVEWICDGMAPLGAEYVAAMRRGLVEQRWVDVYPNRGKRAGAFSMGAPGTHPFIMMSYNDDIFGLSTLAHELGHSMHSYHTRATQPFVYANYGLFVAEVASNFNQAVVRSHLLGQLTARDQQIAIIEEAMANFHRYFFIMPTLARFELAIHERVEAGGALTAAYLIDLMADLFSEGYGDEVVVDRPRVGSTWMQFSTHLYANFYVYQYATGISGAHALARGVLAGEEGAADRYLQFLKAGSSRYPLDALRLAGVDMASSAPVEETFGVLAGYVERLEALL